MEAQKPSLAMILLRGVLFVALGIFANRAILDVLHGDPNVAGIVVIVIMCGLLAWITWGLWRRYA